MYARGGDGPEVRFVATPAEEALSELCLNENGSRDRARERLYVGMSRATDQLVVVGDPPVSREIGGADVARRLGIA